MDVWEWKTAESARALQTMCRERWRRDFLHFNSSTRTLAAAFVYVHAVRFVVLQALCIFMSFSPERSVLASRYFIKKLLKTASTVLVNGVFCRRLYMHLTFLRKFTVLKKECHQKGNVSKTDRQTVLLRRRIQNYLQKRNIRNFYSHCGERNFCRG